MSIEKDLRKDGITNIIPLDTLSVTLIAKYVAEKYIAYFPFSNMRYNDLFIKISGLNMYTADIAEGVSEANYLYKNNSIYFKNGLSMDEMQELTIHEFMHHFQEKKDKNNTLYRLGLCDCTTLNPKGMALNEAAVQYISSKILKKNMESAKYYDITFSTISPNYYPIICNLVSQMAYITGDDILVDSTLYANDKFKNCFIKLCGKKVYDNIEKNLDRILDLEKQISLYNSVLNQEDLPEKDIVKYSLKSKNCKEKIKDIYIKTQNSIFTSYFDNKLYKLYSEQDIEDYRKKLYTYKDYIGVVDNYTYFYDYYINMMSNLEVVKQSVATATSITIYKRNKVQIAFSIIRSIFGKGFETENAYTK